MPKNKTMTKMSGRMKDLKVKMPKMAKGKPNTKGKSK